MRLPGNSRLRFRSFWHGIRRLQPVLEAEYGLDLSGWHLQNASGITPDGSVIAGWGTNPSGQTEAFRVGLKTVASGRHL